MAKKSTRKSGPAGKSRSSSSSSSRRSSASGSAGRRAAAGASARSGGSRAAAKGGRSGGTRAAAARGGKSSAKSRGTAAAAKKSKGAAMRSGKRATAGASSSGKRRSPAVAAAAARKQGTRSRGKVGDSRRTAETFADRNDFGVEQDNREYQMRKSDEIREREGGDHAGSRQPRAGVDSREAGVGGQEAGTGSFSGGDTDTDVTGVGTGGTGVAQSGPDDQANIAAAETSGGSETFASGPPAEGRNQPARSRRDAQLRAGTGDTVDHSGGDASTQGAGVDVETTGTGRTTHDQFGAGHAPIDPQGDSRRSGAAGGGRDHNTRGATT